MSYDLLAIFGELGMVGRVEAGLVSGLEFFREFLGVEVIVVYILCRIVCSPLL